MTPVVCRVKHSPDEGMYGDCVRACVASIMDMDAEQVPHFHHDNPGGVVANARMREWLAGQGYQPFTMHFDPSMSLASILETNGVLNPDTYYMLFGGVEGGGDHVIVCRGGKIVHDPSWYNSAMVRPASYGYWSITVIARA